MSEENNNKTHPSWMDDELVRDIPKRKLDFLGQLFADGHGKSQKEMMAYMLPMMRRAKEEQLAFTSREMSAAIAAIKKHSTPEELSQIDKILSQSKQAAQQKGAPQ